MLITYHHFWMDLLLSIVECNELELKKALGIGWTIPSVIFYIPSISKSSKEISIVWLLRAPSYFILTDLVEIS